MLRPLLRRDHARARLLRFRSAVRHSALAALPAVGMDGPVGAAQQQLGDGFGMANARGQVQRRESARQTAAGTQPPHSPADSPQAGTAHPKRLWAFTSAPNATSDRTIRRLPLSAASCSAVLPLLCTAGPGCGGGPRGGTPVPKPVTEHKTAGRPRGSTMCSFWVTVNGRESTPRGLGVVAISHPARASTKRGKLQQVAGTAIAGEGGGEKSGDSARRQGSVRATGIDVVTGMDERLHAASKPDWCLMQGGDSAQQGRIGRATTASRVH